MEFLKRKIKADREENQENMTGSLINGVRLSLRWADPQKPENDVVMNLTHSETELLKKIIKGERGKYND